MSSRTLFGFVHAQVPARKIVTVEPFDSCCCCGRVNKLDKGESSWATGLAIDRQEDITQLAHFRKKAFQLLVCRLKTQVPYKKFGANAVLLVKWYLSVPT